MYSENDLLPLSVQQHMVFCPLQCALIHIEQTWTESGALPRAGLCHERKCEEDRESHAGY